MSDDKPQAKETCCPYRRKIVVNVTAVLPESVCGVPDSDMADLLRFDLEVESGHPVLAFRYCPWCGTQRNLDDEVRITDVIRPDPPETDA